MTRARRKSIILSARAAAERGEHETARILFATVDMSYVPAKDLQWISVVKEGN